jgi:pimeloyl-ACP methyl ester carboxylesterase
MSLDRFAGLTAMTPTTHTIEAPGAVLAYDVRESDDNGHAPALLMIGSPMDARGFVSLADRFPDRTVVTYDPRGTERSEKDDPASESTPDEHADDLHRIISALDGGPVDIFATSGGAVNALALVARHPEQVRTLVAHEPPAPQVMPDREQALAAVEAIRDTYRRDGRAAGMGKFIALTSIQGPIPADFADQPAPDPAAFGTPDDEDRPGADPLLGQNLVTCNRYEQDFDALRAAPTRIVVAVGAESEGTFAYRGGIGVAERLGTDPVTFPSHHGGFMGDEFGYPGDPDGFAARLREVLTAPVPR